MKKGLFAAVLASFLVALPVSAHVVVKPSEVGVAAWQTFTMGVPNEKEVPTTAVRLLIPEGLENITPNVKPGWTIEVKKVGEGEEAKVTEVIWSGGSIPAGQRDEFLFSAKIPASEMNLNWKAYQTYQGGEVVAWDEDPNVQPAGHAHESSPYSVTKVVNDLAMGGDKMQPGMKGEKEMKKSKGDRDDKTAECLSVLALIVALVALGLQIQSRRKIQKVS